MSVGTRTLTRAPAAEAAGAGPPRQSSTPGAADLPLAAASMRLRRPAGRPRKHPVPPAGAGGLAIQGAAGEPALGAPSNGHRAATLPRRGLAAPASAAFLGISLRQLWRLAERGLLRPVRWPGCRRVVFDLADLEALFSDAYKDGRP